MLAPHASAVPNRRRRLRRRVRPAGLGHRGTGRCHRLPLRELGAGPVPAHLRLHQLRRERQVHRDHLQVGTLICLRYHGVQACTTAPQRACLSNAPALPGGGEPSTRVAPGPAARPGRALTPFRTRAQRACSLQRPRHPDALQRRRVRPEPELAQPGRVVVTERPGGELLLHPLEPGVVTGRLERGPVGPRLHRPADRVLHRAREQASPPRPGRAAAPPPPAVRRPPHPPGRAAAGARAAGRAARCRGRTPAAPSRVPISTSWWRAWPSSWATTDERLALGHVVDQVVVEHHPSGAAEAGDVGVQGRRTPRRVGHQHVGDRHLLLLGPAPGSSCAASRLRQRGEVVEQRLDHHGVDPRAEHGQHRARQRRPTAASAAVSDGPRPARPAR